MDTEYHAKYIKYKNKYLHLKNNQLGGAHKKKAHKKLTKSKKNKIYTQESKYKLIEFIKKAPLNKIIDDLPKMLFDNKTYCDEIMGEGMMGEVIVSSIGPTMDVKVGNTAINIPVVIKKAKMDGTFDMKIINGKLYAYSYRNLVVEAILLYYVSDLWYKKLSPHLPLMIGYGSCNPNTKTIVSRIITERHGMDHKVKIKMTQFDEGPLWHPDGNFISGGSYFESNFSTISDLFKYIGLFRKGDIIVLPNSKKVNIIKLCDYLSISFLHTFQLLYDHGITLTDMHPGNIFLHWLNEKSYMGNQSINDIEYIIYEINNKYYKIETFGFVLKIGDIGSSILHPRDDVYILGQGVNLEKTYPIVEQITKPNSKCGAFLYLISYNLPFELYQQTIAYQILSNYPYSEMYYFGIPQKLLDDQLNTSEILEKFEDYRISKPKKSSNTLIIGL